MVQPTNSYQINWEENFYKIQFNQFYNIKIKLFIWNVKVPGNPGTTVQEKKFSKT